MNTLNPLEALKLGVIGLGFLLALLAYWLLKREQGRERTRPGLLKAVYAFMAFSVLLCAIGLVAEWRPVDPALRSAQKNCLSRSEAEAAHETMQGVLTAYVWLERGDFLGARSKLDEAITKADASDVYANSEGLRLARSQIEREPVGTVQRTLDDTLSALGKRFSDRCP